MDIRPFQTCRSLEGWFVVRIESSSDPGKRYVVHVNPWGDTAENICECQGYLYRGHCRHQTMAKDAVCGWQEGLGEEVQTEMQRKMKTCPRCGGPTRWEFEVVEPE
jgi:hypothetical protein